MIKKGFLIGLKRSFVTFLSVATLVTGMPTASVMAAELPEAATMENVVGSEAATMEDVVGSETATMEDVAGSEEAATMEDVVESEEDATMEDVDESEEDATMEDVVVESEAETNKEEVAVDATYSDVEEQKEFKINLMYADGCEVKTTSGNNPNYVYPLKDYTIIKSESFLGSWYANESYGDYGTYFVMKQDVAIGSTNNFQLLVDLPNKKVKTAKLFRHGETEELVCELSMSGTRSVIDLGTIEFGEYDVQVEFESDEIVEEQKEFKINLMYAEGCEVTTVSGNNSKYVYPLEYYTILKSDSPLGSRSGSTYGKNGVTFVAEQDYGTGNNFTLLVNLPNKKVKVAKIFKHGDSEGIECSLGTSGTRSVIDLGVIPFGEYDVQVEFEDAKFNKVTLKKGIVQDPYGIDFIHYDDLYIYKKQDGSFDLNTLDKSIEFVICYNGIGDLVLKDAKGNLIECIGQNWNYYRYSIDFDSVNSLTYTYDITYKKANATFNVEKDDNVINLIVDSGMKKNEDGSYSVSDKSIVEFKVVLDGYHTLQCFPGEYMISCEKTDVKYGTSAKDTQVTYVVKYPVSEIDENTIEFSGEEFVGYGGTLAFGNLPEGTVVNVTDGDGNKTSTKYTEDEFYGSFNIDLRGIGDKYTVELVNDAYTFKTIKTMNTNTHKETSITGNKFSFVADGAYVLVAYESNARIGLWVEGHEKIYDAGQTIEVEPDSEYTYMLKKGNEIPAIEYTLKSGTTVVEKDTTTEYIQFKTSLMEYAGKTLTLICEMEDGKVATFYIKIKSTLSEVKLAGKTTGITQSLGEEVAYTVTFNAGFDRRYLYGVSCDSAKCSFGYDVMSNRLFISQYISVYGEYDKEVNVIFEDAFGKTVKVPVTFNNDLLVNSIPTVKVKGTSDTSIILDISSNIINRYYDDAEYSVSWEEITTKENKLEGNCKAIYNPAGAFTLKLDVIPEDQGKGYAADFKISIYLKDQKGNKSKIATLAKVSTKNPSYAMSFKMKTIAPKVYAVSSIPVAEAVFDAKASYIELSKAEIIDSPKNYDDYPWAELPVIWLEGNRVYMSATDHTIPGNYTISVTSMADEGVKPFEATFKVQVINDIPDFDNSSISFSTGSIVKKAKGNATVKVTAVYRNCFNQVVKPKKSSMLLLGLSQEMNYEIFNKNVSINNSGIISITPSYQVKDDSELNEFGVICVWESASGAYNEFMCETTCGIKESKDIIDHILVKSPDNEQVDLTKTLTVKDLVGSKIFAFNENGEVIDSVSYTITGGKVLADGIIDAVKVGTSTISVRTTDGGNSTAKVTVKTAYISPETVAIVTSGGECEAGSEVRVQSARTKFTLLTGEDAVLNDNSMNLSVSVSGGTISKNTSLDVLTYNIFIAKDKALITIKDKASNKVYKYTVINELYKANAEIKAIKFDKVYAGCEGVEQTLRFKLPEKSGDIIKLVAGPTTVAGLTGSSVAAKTATSVEYIYDEETGYYVAETTAELPKGNYTFNYILFDENEEILANPVKGTISVVAVPTVSVPAKISVSAKKADSSASVKVKVGKGSIDNTCGVKAYNMCIAGHGNDFESKTLVSTSSNGELVVELNGLDKFESLQKNDRTGYVDVEVYDIVGRKVTKTIKVTISVR